MPSQAELYAIAKALIINDEFLGVEITGHHTMVLDGASAHTFVLGGRNLNGSLFVIEQPPGAVKSLRYTPGETKP